MTKDRDELAAAIATPEVYAEVVTRVLEIERGKLLKQLRDITIRFGRAVEACRLTVDLCDGTPLHMTASPKTNAKGLAMIHANRVIVQEADKEKKA